ncbi:MAG: 30S ribosomal protein S16 [Planctomycetota bacterium]|nr:30S ribosomal protein S16 [Planctomycetota bacterium]
MVRIRLQRLGRRNRSCYRIVVTDARVKRQGAYLEKLGQYDPVQKDNAKKFAVDTERVTHWIAQGAQPTEAVENVLQKCGFKMPPKPVKPKAPSPKAVAPAKK